MNENHSKVKSLSKAISLLDILSTADNGMKLSELSELLGYPKSTVHALLSTMRDRGLINQLDNGYYTLGIKLFEYGSAVSRSFDISSLARPYLNRLSSLTGANAVISMLDDRGVVSFDYAASASGVQILPEIGVRLPLHCTSQGKLMLSSLTNKKAEALLKRQDIIPYTPHTITKTDLLLAQLDTIRARGYSVEDGEYKIGLRSVSAPVYDNTGIMRYTMTTIGFFRRATSDDFITAAENTVNEAQLLSSALGYRK